MKRTIILTTLLVIVSLIQSYGQTGDTITCYNNAELKRITTRVVYANECDTLLTLSIKEIGNLEHQINNCWELVDVKDSIIVVKDSMISAHGQISDAKDIQLKDKDKKIKKLNRKLKWTQAGWATSSLGLLALLVLVIL